MRYRTTATALLVLVLSIVATVFTLLATTNKEWSSQAYYFDPDSSSLGIGDINPVCTLHRSPFYRCGIPEVVENGTCNIPYCAWYAPSGRNKTSCRSAAEYGVSWSEVSPARGLLGRRTECQEVHYAGNLQIAAATLITFGLMVALVMVTFSVSTLSTKSSPQDTQESTINEDGSKERQTDVVVSRSHEHRSPRSPRNSTTPYVAVLLLTCLYVGAFLQFLAQFFGVLGLTVNATPGYDGAVAAQKNTTRAYYVADDWAMGKGLTTYATAAWVFAIAGAAVTSTVYRTPRFVKLL